jgi:hypothetical protein
MRVRRAVVIKDSVNVKGYLSAHRRSWASMPRRQVGHLRGRVSQVILIYVITLEDFCLLSQYETSAAKDSNFKV